jgi:8-amino-7-oxononanoate synthase
MITRQDSFEAALSRQLEESRAAHLYRSLRVMGRNGEVLSFADNDYLGLARDPRVVEAFREAAVTHGAGAGASRLLSGTTDLHERLETEIARFKRKETALVYGSGYLANLGIVSALVSEKDIVVVDKLNHASLIDACRLSGARLRVYPHKHLSKLRAILEKSASYRRRLIVTDSVFSMDGDVAPLPELAEIKEKYEAALMVDEAHGTGVFGKTGRGVAEHFGVEDKVDISMGTLSKAVGVFGGFAAGSRVLGDYLVNFSRPFIFATALPPPVAAACLEGLRIIAQEPELRQKLWENVSKVKSALTAMGYEIGASESPIIPLLVGSEEKAMQLSEALEEEGIYIPAIRYPTVGRGKARLRLTVSARHEEEDLQSLFRALRKVRELL